MARVHLLGALQWGVGAVPRPRNGAVHSWDAGRVSCSRGRGVHMGIRVGFSFVLCSCVVLAPVLVLLL